MAAHPRHTRDRTDMGLLSGAESLLPVRCVNTNDGGSGGARGQTLVANNTNRWQPSDQRYFS